MQLQADLSQLIVNRPANIEATALGAAKCAAHYDQFWDVLPTQTITKFSPTTNQDELLQQWDSVLRNSLSST